ncbi:MAG TPA: DUF4344 domain-containing metallopeptidase [Solirubrobacteraceae bacterium]|jgi:hypothetical protein|nr:DUF4344 domain-containing metallopeptidase [Solirubrobacteraceae bacterium]
MSIRAARTAGVTCVSLAAGLAGLTGCGGGSKAPPAKPTATTEFKQAYSAERASLNGVSNQIGTIITGADKSTDAQLIAQFNLVEPRYRAELTKLDALKPPPALAALFTTLKTAAGVLDTDLGKITAAVTADDAAAAGKASQQLAADVPGLTAAAGTLRAKLGLPASPEPSRAPTGAITNGRISVVYDPPKGADAKVAKQVLSLGGTDGVASGLSESFKLPTNITIHVVNAFVGPDYDPRTQTITLSYAFVNYEAEVLETNFPDLRHDDSEPGRELAAVDGFILLHELGHALISVYTLPVLGKEEDAADSIATVFLTRLVTNGAEYAFDAARFFHALSARQRQLAPSDYWDAHSLDQQRAYSIVCWIAGSSAKSMHAVAKLGLLPRSRLDSCGSEYQQTVQSWVTLLSPHLRA